jgi:hypothetical protein
VERLRSWSFIDDPHKIGLGQGIGNAECGIHSIGKLVFRITENKEELIGKFGTLVEEKNGKFLGTLFIRRGRIYWQKTPGEVNEEVRDALDARQRMWPMTAKTD